MAVLEADMLDVDVFFPSLFGIISIAVVALDLAGKWSISRTSTEMVLEVGCRVERQPALKVTQVRHLWAFVPFFEVVRR
jgi:hypothetical protein